VTWFGFGDSKGDWLGFLGNTQVARNRLGLEVMGCLRWSGTLIK